MALTATKTDDVVVHLPINGQREDDLFASTLEAFAKWLSESCMADEAPSSVFVTTEMTGGAARKTLIFEERRSAAAFLVFWRQQKRQAFGSVAPGPLAAF